MPPRSLAALLLAFGAASLPASCSPITAAAAEEGVDAEASAPDQPIDEVVVRGVRSGRLSGSPSAFSSEIRSEDYAGERKSIEELLGQQVGVQLRRFGGPGEPAELSIRGSTSSQVKVTLDGVEMNSALTGGTDLSQLCLGLIERAEVTRGGGSLQAGGGAIGGVVALETLRPSAEARNRIEASGGGFDTWQASLLRSARAGPLDYGVGWCGFWTEGDYRFARPLFQGLTLSTFSPPVIQRINNRRERQAGSLDLGGELGEHAYLRFRDYVSYASYGEPGPDAADGPDGGQNPRAHSRDLNNIAQLELAASDLGWLGDELEVGLHHRWEQNRYTDPGLTEIDEPSELETKLSTLGLRASDLWQGRLLLAEHRLSLRGDARDDTLYANDRADQSRATLSAMLQEDARFFDERVTLVPALRVEWTEGFPVRWLPGLGVVLAPLPWLRIKGNIQKSYRPPAFDELYFPDKGFIRGNPALEPESARNADVGLELGLEQIGPIESLKLSASFFQQDIDDSIVWLPISPRTVSPENTGPARVRGYELALSFALLRLLRLSANHTGLDSESLTTGLPLAGRPESETYFRAELGPPRLLKLVGELHHSGIIPVSASGSLTLPARSVWNASAALNLAGIRALQLGRFVDELWLYLGVDNIADVAVRDMLFFPQPGRSAHAGVELAW